MKSRSRGGSTKKKIFNGADCQKRGEAWQNQKPNLSNIGATEKVKMGAFHPVGKQLSHVKKGRTYRSQEHWGEEKKWIEDKNPGTLDKIFGGTLGGERSRDVSEGRPNGGSAGGFNVSRGRVQGGGKKTCWTERKEFKGKWGGGPERKRIFPGG